jgi:hypothetical protein
MLGKWSMLVGQKIACEALAMMIFLGISSRREMAAKEGDGTQTCPLTEKMVVCS